MKPLDRLLQRWRIAKARPFIPPGARVLDIGSADGALFDRLQSRVGEGLGIDPHVPSPRQVGRGRLLRGFFPADMPDVPPFDVITMLAVLEHFPDSQHAPLAEGCARFLRPGGRLILTVPSPSVDSILKVLLRLGVVDGMSLEEHHGFDVEQTVRIFGPPRFRLLKRARFQLGLNHLFVFERRPD
jgi:2-polyprenyl-3-methyl-5-hydroxy-6-metoxy-1,4-benzoquinol methylase